jgi:hypothetical protein
MPRLGGLCANGKLFGVISCKNQMESIRHHAANKFLT